MKRTISALLLVLMSVSSFAPVAQANGRRQQHRYRSTYRQFDGGFHNHYGYSENREVCRTTYSGGWSSSTCYDIQPDRNVYVQEQILEDGRSRVTVYNNEDDTSPFIEYYVQHDVVVYRHYYNGWGYGYSDYTTYSYVTTEWAINWDSGWGKIIGGFEVGVIGASVLTDSNGRNDTATNVVGGLILGSGIASSISGALQLQHETELQKAIAAQAKAENAAGNDVL